MARFSPLALALLALLPWVTATGFRPYDPIQDKNVELLRRESSYEIDYVLENEKGEIIGYSGEADVSIDASNATDFSERRSSMQKRATEQCSSGYTARNGQTTTNLFNCQTIINHEFTSGRAWRVGARKSRIWSSTSNYNPQDGSIQYCQVAIYNPSPCNYYDATASVMHDMSSKVWYGCSPYGYGGVVSVDDWGSACVSIGGMAYNTDSCYLQ
ncbi:MAG: hypothetical protein M1813_005970 [Trichoglossum hirsutum]|nr:MAG: hypothetical protein M1813_005970 [Trichoglossum hirsutum]